MSVLIVFALTACSATNTDEAQPPISAVEPVAEEPAIEPEELNQLLEAAQLALDKEHLTFPKRGSAFALYSDILARQPGQEDATRGLEHIVERYVELSLAALEREQYATARSMLARGRLILPHHPSIEPTAAQIRLLQEADRLQLKLSPQVLKDPRALTRELAVLVDKPDAGAVAKCRFKIWAGNDRTGREIYQSLSRAYADSLGTSAEETPRLKAQLGVRSPSGVERICFKKT